MLSPKCVIVNGLYVSLRAQLIHLVDQFPCRLCRNVWVLLHLWLSVMEIILHIASLVTAMICSLTVQNNTVGTCEEFSETWCNSSLLVKLFTFFSVSVKCKHYGHSYCVSAFIFMYILAAVWDTKPNRNPKNSITKNGSSNHDCDKLYSCCTVTWTVDTKTMYKTYLHNLQLWNKLLWKSDGYSWRTFICTYTLSHWCQSCDVTWTEQAAVCGMN